MSPPLPDGLLEQLVECAPDGILAVDQTGHILFANHQIEVLLGYPRDELIGQPVEMLLPKRFRAAHASHRQDFTARPALRPMGYGGALQVRRKDGTELDVDISLAPLPGPVGAVAAVMRDATERVRARSELEHRALHDALTGLPNRALLMDRLHTALTRQIRSNLGTGVMFFDIDRLKAVNDTLGHAAGDALIAAVGDRVARVLRPADTLGRLGGDEFVVVVEQVRAAVDLCELADRMLAAVRAPLRHGDHDLLPGISLGIAFARPGRLDAEAVLREADTAMYRVKRAGRGSYALAPSPAADAVVDADHRRLVPRPRRTMAT